MPAVSVSLWYVLLAAAVQMVLGSLWYSKVLFAKPWMESIGRKVEDIGKPGPEMVLMALGALITAYVLAHFVAFAAAKTVMLGLETGVWAWLGFVLPVTGGIKLFEQRSTTWFAITAGYYLVGLMVMGAILANHAHLV